MTATANLIDLEGIDGFLVALKRCPLDLTTRSAFADWLRDRVMDAAADAIEAATGLQAEYRTGMRVQMRFPTGTTREAFVVGWVFDEDEVVDRLKVREVGEGRNSYAPTAATVRQKIKAL